MQRALASMASRYFISSCVHAETLTRLDMTVDGRVTDRSLFFVVGSFSRPSNLGLNQLFSTFVSLTVLIESTIG